MALTTEIEEIAALARHLQPTLARHLAPTPLEERELDGHRVLLKREDRLPTGSFKVRGALARLLEPPPGARGFTTCSAGNFGMGAAHAARELGLELEIFVPSDAPQVKKAGIRALGAVLHEARSAGYDDAEREARAHAERAGRCFLSPFDDLHVMAGNGTLVLELSMQAPELKEIFCPVGGGGLVCGVAAVARGQRPEATVRGTQGERTRAMRDSLERGRAITRVDPVETLADGLEGGVSQRTFRIAAALGLEIGLASEAELASAIAYADSTWDLVVEGAAATAIAVARRALRAGHCADGAPVILLTGRNIDDTRHAEITRC